MKEDYYAKLPLRVSDALERGELTFNQHGVLTFIIGRIDFRTGAYVRTLRGLAEALQWRLEDNTLSSRVLRPLRDGGWLAFESAPGRRKPYVFRLGPKLANGATSVNTSDAEAMPQSEVILDSRRSQEAAIQHREALSTGHEVRTDPNSPEEKRTEEKNLSRRDMRARAPQGECSLPATGSAEVVFDTLAALCCPPTNDHERAKHKKASTLLRQSLRHDSIPEDGWERELHRRAKRWTAVFPSATLTAMGLASNWAVLAPPPEKFALNERPAEPEPELLAREESARRAAELAERYGEAAT